MKKILICAGILLACFQPDHCEAAPAKGIVCKAKVLKQKKCIKEDGKAYVLAVKDDAETTQCVNEINAKRREKYEAIAEKENVPVEEIEKIAAQKLAK